MREFMRFQFEHSLDRYHLQWSPIHFVGNLIHNVHARHVAQEIALRDDHMLADIGLFRSEVEHAAHGLITHDALEELEDARSHHDDATADTYHIQGQDLGHLSTKKMDS